MAKQTFTTGQVLTAAQMTSLQQTAMLGGAASAKTASYTLVAADAGTAISMTNAGATTITVNTGLFAAGDTVHITNLGVGVCTITAGTATVNSSASLALAQYESGFLDFTSTSAAIFVKGAGAAAASGGMTLLTSGTFANDASVTLSSISGSYNDLHLRVYNFRPATDGEQLYIRFNGDTGNNYINSLRTDGDSTSIGFANRYRFFGDTDNGASTLGAGELRITNYASTSVIKGMQSDASSTNQNTPPNQRIEILAGLYNSTSAITSLTMVTGGGNITSGTYYLYGVK